MISVVKKILPSFVIKWLKKRKLQIDLIMAYRYDYIRYYRYSATKGYSDKVKLEGIIIKTYHIIEKGLTMPEPRLGFGVNRVLELCDNCVLFVTKYGLTDQIEHAISVLYEYKKFHSEKKYPIDNLIQEKINDIVAVSHINEDESSKQIKMTKNDYFKFTNGNFPQFSNSRKSIRNYSANDEISIETINNIIKLATNSPSACNRQTARVYVYTDKKYIDQILSIQNGNRGFGHLANKLLIVTAEIGVFANPMERNQAFIDGGIFAMNLLYSIHYHQIVACMLNCSNTPTIDKELRKVCGIKDSEEFIAMISCGVALDEFSVAISPRYSNCDICTIKNQIL